MFVVAESDMEVLRHLQNTHKSNVFFVYSTTMASVARLDELITEKFKHTAKQAKSTIDVLNDIQNRDFQRTNTRFETYVLLDCQIYIHDPQTIRKVKDIIARYQLDENFTVSLIFMSQVIGVPMQLERLTEVVFFDLPDETSLKQTSEALAEKLDLKKDAKNPEKHTWPSDEVVNNLKGLTHYEVEQAYLQSFNMYKKVELNFVRDFKKNAIAKTDLLSLMESDVTFNDVGGLENLKNWIQKSYGGWTVRGKEYGLPLLKGLLLVGIPGTGKSLISKSIGNEWGLPVIAFDPSRIFSSRVGDSEQNMRRVLQIVENISPCILFIDEIEKGLAGMQSSTFSDSGVTARVIGSFLIWLQDCKKPVFTVATANAIQYLPPELISRFDETFFVNMPATYERQDIFKIHLKKLNRKVEEFDLKKLAEASQDLSGREIEQTLRESMYDAFYKGKEMNTDTILTVLSKKTSLLTTMAEQLKYLLEWVGWDEDKKDGIRARFASSFEDRARVQDEIEKMLKDVESKGGKLKPPSTPNAMK
jgi:AAA+ superfamily predicted ATPase